MGEAVLTCHAQRNTARVERQGLIEGKRTKEHGCKHLPYMGTELSRRVQERGELASKAKWGPDSKRTKAVGIGAKKQRSPVMLVTLLVSKSNTWLKATAP